LVGFLTVAGAAGGDLVQPGLPTPQSAGKHVFDGCRVDSLAVAVALVQGIGHGGTAMKAEAALVLP
jgi:hypothetical protein